jgi:hypothetical protein
MNHPDAISIHQGSYNGIALALEFNMYLAKILSESYSEIDLPFGLLIIEHCFKAD